MERATIYDQAAVFYLNAAQVFSDQHNYEQSLSLVTRATNIAPHHCQARLVAANLILVAGRSVEEILPHLEAASWQHNCTDTWLQAMDSLVGAYLKLLEQRPNDIRLKEGWDKILPRAQDAQACLNKRKAGISC